MRLCEIICVFAVFIVTILSENVVYNFRVNHTSRAFPDDFLFGAATSAYQIEGAWNTDGRGPSIWDEFVHSHPEKVVDRQNADIGPNSYEFYKDDVDILKNLSMNFYRFSISWSRVLPTGDISEINEKGIEYYNNVINTLLERGIEPMITMFHWDLPQKLQLLGGLTNSIIVKYFEAYANLLFERFGDRVKYWLTFNESFMFCLRGYGKDWFAPGINMHGIGEYLCMHNALKAHAVAYRLYKKSYYKQFKGKIGLTCNARYYYSHSNDTGSVDRALQFTLGWCANPIFSTTGNYPAVMIEQIANNSAREGRSWSRLPEFSKEWINTIRGSADFFGLNYYTSRYVETPSQPEGETPSYQRDLNVNEIVEPEWKAPALSWIYSVPKGLGDILRWIHNQYDNPNIYILENGWFGTGGLVDDDRIEYLHDHLNQVLDTIVCDGVKVKGYAVWSMIDNFEWISGYNATFGLYSVNISSPRRERTPRKSASFMRTVTTTHSIPNIN